VYEGTGFFITVAAFRNLSTSEKVIKDLRTKGENPLLVRNKSKTWYLIVITRYENEQTALDKMKEARANGYENAWVHIKQNQ
jgi:cell division septation protein DedD